MVEPVTMMTMASMGMSAAGGVSGMKGGKASAKSAMQAARFNNQITEQQNKILAFQNEVNQANVNRQSDLTIAVGDLEIKRLSELANAIDGDNQHAASFANYYGQAEIAKTQAGFAAMGVSTTEGSPLITRMVQESMLAREVAEINLQGERMQVDVRNQAKAAKFNQELGLQNLRSQANMQRLGTQINIQKNKVAAMQNTMQGQATAAQAKAQGTQALLSGLGNAAMMGVQSGAFKSTPSTPSTPAKIIESGATRVGSIGMARPVPLAPGEGIQVRR